jgi:hypothetical protein
MNSTDLLVYGLCGVMIAAGIAMIWLSDRQRGMGAIGIVLGLIGLLAYVTGEEGAPPPDFATPTVEVAATAPATPAP